MRRRPPGRAPRRHRLASALANARAAGEAEIDASPELTQTGVDPAADFAKATGGGIGSDPLVDIGPMREIFMVQNINRLAKPGLVLIGSAHVDRIKARIVDGKFHALYPDFERDLLT